MLLKLHTSYFLIWWKVNKMTFTARVKDEITSTGLNEIENRNLFLGYIFTNAERIENKIEISLENLNVARKIYKTIKYCYHVDVKTTIRTEKKFKMKTLYIFEIDDKNGIFKSELQNIHFDDDEESRRSFIMGVFLASGSINDPEKSHYHLEMSFQTEEKANLVKNLLNEQGFGFKVLKREKNYMLYLKSSEKISDFLKLLGAVNSLFYYEDIRIYRDHANMVNRLNNCEQANYEKSLKTGDRQLSIIRFLKENDYMSLLDEKTRQVAEYRLKYPEESFQSLADILTTELDKKVTKSYINHHFRKINEIYNRIEKSKEIKKHTT